MAVKVHYTDMYTFTKYSKAVTGIKDIKPCKIVLIKISVAITYLKWSLTKVKVKIYHYV